MAKLTQTEIKMLADEWALTEKKIEKAQRSLERELDPFIVEHNEAVKPVLAKWQPKIGRLEARRNEIAETIADWLVDHGKPVSLEGMDAVAANVLQTSSRKLDAKSFFERVKDRSEAFWECVTIAIQKADRYLGKDQIDEWATKEAKLVPRLMLKNQQ